MKAMIMPTTAETYESEYSSHQWSLSLDQKKYFARLRQRAIEDGKPMVEWGWKRDEIKNGVRAPNSRTVYFSADLGEAEGEVNIERAFFFLDSRAKKEEIQMLVEQIGKSRMIAGYQLKILSWDARHEGYARLRLTIGRPTGYDLKTIKRRLKGKPRLSIPAPRLVPDHGNYNLSSFAPFALCAGSGLSAESGLPLLGSIHNLFEVDNMETGELVFGVADTLPGRIVNKPAKLFKSFCKFTIDAVKAEPSGSHLLIADLHRKGIIRQIFTDNMDDILEKTNLPYTRTRLSIFPDRFPAEFDPGVKSLLVVGVAVDRRDVIKQARAAGLKIIAVNPIMGVAPHSRNMDYLRRGDILFRQKAEDALPKIIKASGF